MRKDILNMSQKERQRYHLLKMVLGGKNTLKDAGKRMGIRSMAELYGESTGVLSRILTLPFRLFQTLPVYREIKSSQY
jgi:hypothetical protein